MSIAQAPIAFWSGLLALMKAVVMPCFCLISGHVSPIEIDERRARQLIQLLAVFLIFQGLYLLQNMLALHLNHFRLRALPLQLFHPYQPAVTWFLIALLVWRLTMPLIRRTCAPMLLSLLFGLSGLFVDLGVNYQNIIAFWPYFVAGALLPCSRWELLHHPPVRTPCVLLFCVCTAALLLFSAFGGRTFRVVFEQLTLTYACLNGAPPRDQADVCCTAHELAMRLTFYVLSCPVIAGFLCMVPRESSWLSASGHMSMYVYLLHPCLLFNPIAMQLVFDALSSYYRREVNVWSPATDADALTILAPGALLGSVLLSSPPTRLLFWALVEPPLDACCCGTPIPSPTADAPRPRPAETVCAEGKGL